MTARQGDPPDARVDHVIAALDTPFPDDAAAVRWLRRRHGGDDAAWAAAGFGAACRERQERRRDVERLRREMSDAEPRGA
jgi:hypothetical protein